MRNNLSFDPNQKINYHISSSRMKTPLIKVGYFSSMSENRSSINNNSKDTSIFILPCIDMRN